MVLPRTRCSTSTSNRTLLTGTKQALDEAIVELEMHVSNQGNTFIAAKGSTQKQLWLRTILLRNHMAPINRVARLKLGDTPELAPFLMPRGKPTTERLAGLANGMADAAIPFTATFIAAGLPADFVPQLKSVVVQMVQSLSDRSLTHGKRRGATTSLKGVLTKGRKIVSVLDVFVRKDLHLLLRLEVQVPRYARDDSSSAITNSVTSPKNDS